MHEGHLNFFIPACSLLLIKNLHFGSDKYLTYK